jgi:hypothetical protein
VAAAPQSAESEAFMAVARAVAGRVSVLNGPRAAAPTASNEAAAHVGHR